MYATRSRLWNDNTILPSVRVFAVEWKRIQINSLPSLLLWQVVSGGEWEKKCSCTESAIRMKQKPKLWREHVFRWWWCRSVSTDSGKCGATTATTAMMMMTLQKRVKKLHPDRHWLADCSTQETHIPFNLNTTRCIHRHTLEPSFRDS